MTIEDQIAIVLIMKKNEARAKRKAKQKEDLAKLNADIQKKKEIKIKEEAKKSRREYRTPYSGFEWQSRHAQLIHLRSQWPTQQHVIMARMFYEWFTHVYTNMDHQRASNILNTSIYRAGEVMLLMKRRKHLSRIRERYGKRRHPYVYTLTEQGKHYGRYIWEHQLDYNLEMMDQLREVARMSSPISQDSIEEFNRDILTIDYSVVNYDLKCQMDLDKIWKR